MVATLAGRDSHARQVNIRHLSADLAQSLREQVGQALGVAGLARVGAQEEDFHNHSLSQKHATRNSSNGHPGHLENGRSQ
jgi:hypothetical protein